MNKELFARKAGTRHIPIAQVITPQPVGHPETGGEPVMTRQLDPTMLLEPFDPKIIWPKFCGIKGGCWEIEYTPKTRFHPANGFFTTRYKGTLRVERNGFAHTISGDLYKFRGYPIQLEKLGIPARTAHKWQNTIIRPELGPIGPLKPVSPKKCPTFPRNKYYSYLEGTNITYSRLTYTGKCSFTLNFDEWFYTHPASGFDGDFGSNADRSIRMEINKITSTYFTGTVYNGSSNIGSIKLWWRCKTFRTAHLEIFTLEGAEHPPTSVPDGSGGTESFETIFKTAGWKLKVTRNSAKVPLPSSLAGTDINNCWALDDLHDLMDSTPGYNNAQLDKKWRVFLVSVPAKLGCSRGVVFDQSTGDTNSIDREGSATFSHDGFNKSHSSNFGAAEDEQLKDWPRGFLRSAAHEVCHAFNQYHQPQQNSIMCPTPSVADALAVSGDTFPDDIDLSFNDTVRHKLIHQPDPAVRPGAMDWLTAFNVPQADDVNFYDSEDIELEVKTNKRNISIGEPVEVNWTVTNKMGTAVNIPGSIGPDQHTTRVSISKPNGEVVHMRLPLDAHDDAHAPQSLAAGKSTSSGTTVFWSRKGFAFDQPGRHEVNVILIWEDSDIYFAVESSTEVWVNYPVSARDNEVAALMMNDDVGRFILTGNKKRFPKGAKRIKQVLSKHKNHDVSATIARLLDQKYSKKSSK